MDDAVDLRGLVNCRTGWFEVRWVGERLDKGIVCGCRRVNLIVELVRCECETVVFGAMLVRFE
jgi:hypothetical protein